MPVRAGAPKLEEEREDGLGRLNEGMPVRARLRLVREEAVALSLKPTQITRVLVLRLVGENVPLERRLLRHALCVRLLLLRVLPLLLVQARRLHIVRDVTLGRVVAAEADEPVVSVHPGVWEPSCMCCTALGEDRAVVGEDAVQHERLAHGGEARLLGIRHLIELLERALLLLVLVVLLALLLWGVDDLRKELSDVLVVDFERGGLGGDRWVGPAPGAGANGPGTAGST